MEKFTLKGVKITLEIEAIEVEKGQSVADELLDTIRAGIATISTQVEQVEEAINAKLS